jgi:hypothetical protein
MLSTRWIIALALVSTSAFSQVTPEEKERRVEFIEKISEDIPMVNVEVYRRDLKYEKQQLPLDLRARNEANIIAERIKVQIFDLYQSHLKDSGSEAQATSDVLTSIENDLTLVAPELRDEIKALALDALNAAKKGSTSEEQNLYSMEKELLPGVEDRAAYLNQIDPDANVVGFAPSVNPNKDADKADYKSKKEVIASLISSKENTRWLSTNGMSVESSKAYSRDTEISYRISIEFLGSSIDAGPVIEFKRDYTTRGIISAEGLTPVLYGNGNFDFYMRDQAGKITKKGGKDLKRFISFYCEAELSFETEYKGSGGFKLAGIGGSVDLGSSYKNKVNLSSRRVMVPEKVDGKTFTMNDVVTICNSGFLNARLNPAMTVKDSLNVMMKNVVSSLRFSNPNTKCLVDSQCNSWFVKEKMPLVRNTATPRCVEVPRDKYRACVVRGLKGTKCPVYQNKQRVSDGMFEYACDQGLKCVQTQEAGWFKNYDLYQYAIGKCMPINPKTYVRPN